MQYDEPNLIKIAGQGRKGIEIYEEYMKLYEDGFNLSVNSACDYLGCSYKYFINNHLINKIKHIRINTIGRKLILLYGQAEQLEPEVLSVFSKRILIDRNDFHNFLRKNLIIEQKYKVFNDSILKSDVADTIRDNLKIYNSRLSKNQPPKDIKSIFEFAIYKISMGNEVVRYPLLKESDLPEKLYSLKEIMNHFGYSNSMRAYRIIDKLGVKKYILGQFVRYDLNEFDRTSDSILKMDYKSYLDLSKNVDVEKKIAEQALLYSQKLVQGGIL
jgi:hypothetical protein